MLGDVDKLYTVVNWKKGWLGVLKGSHLIRPNFQVAEFACSDGSGIVLVDSYMLDFIQELRESIGKPLTINSANRTAQFNQDIGGASKSRHVWGDALDIPIPQGYTPDTFLREIEAVAAGRPLGIGVYSTFIHVDNRGTNARWHG